MTWRGWATIATVGLRLAALTEASNAELHGLYRAEDGRLAAVFPAPSNPAEPALVDVQTGRVRVLHAGQAGSYTFGPSLAVPEPSQGVVAFSRDSGGAIVELQSRKGSEPAEVFRRVALRQTPATFSHGEVTLAGTLILPEGPGPFPGVVMLHGSGPEPREHNLGMALFMASQGVAALIFDKRGVGESTGGQWRAAFDAYAGDALAGFRLMQDDARLDPKRLGYWGHSQGAWIAALAASRTPEARFVVLECGGAVSPVDATLWWTRRRFEAAGEWTPEQIDAALKFERQKFDTVAGRLTKAEFNELTQGVRSEPWFEFIDSRLPDGPFWKANVNYDPAPPLARLGHCAVLALYAEHDDATPTEPSVRAIEAALSRAKHSSYVVHTISRANHAMLETLTGKRMVDELPALDRFCPAYFERLQSWLRETLSNRE